jgi:hypothetical protein
VQGAGGTVVWTGGNSKAKGQRTHMLLKTLGVCSWMRRTDWGFGVRYWTRHGPILNRTLRSEQHSLSRCPETGFEEVSNLR